MKIFDIVKYEGPNDVFVWKFPGEDFNTLSQLVVHEAQEAIFFKDGQALDIFGPGRYTLHTQNIPLIRRVINLPFNGESPFHCEVYFINKAVSMDVKWETPAPMPIQDAIYKIIIPVSSNGQFGVRVVDGKRLLLNLVGTIPKFDQATLKEYFRGILLTNIKDYIAKQFVQKQISFLEIQSYLKEISEGIQNDLSGEFSKYGIELVNFTVNDITPPENDPSYVQLKKALAKKAEMSVMGYDYQQERTFNILDKAAANEGSASGIMNAGMGLGMGLNLGGIVGGAMGNAAANIANMDVQSPNVKKKIKCPKCGEEVPEGSKFCLNCGQKIVSPEDENIVICPQCGASVPKGKFCLECGFEFIKKCSKCGADLIPGAKYCLECGAKVE